MYLPTANGMYLPTYLHGRAVMSFLFLPSILGTYLVPTPRERFKENSRNKFIENLNEGISAVGFNTMEYTVNSIGKILFN